MKSKHEIIIVRMLTNEGQILYFEYTAYCIYYDVIKSVDENK